MCILKNVHLDEANVACAYLASVYIAIMCRADFSLIWKQNMLSSHQRYETKCGNYAHTENKLIRIQEKSMFCLLQQRLSQAMALKHH